MHKNDKSVVIGCGKCSFVVEEVRDDKLVSILAVKLIQLIQLNCQRQIFMNCLKN